jgi:hypothetical protein
MCTMKVLPSTSERAVQVDGGAAIDLDGVVAHHVVRAGHDDGAAAGFDLEVFCGVEGGWGVVPNTRECTAVADFFDCWTIFCQFL